MATLKLSEGHIGAMPLPPSGKNRIDRDTQVQGLGVRITASGHRSYLFCYRFDGRERRLPIGDWIKGEATLNWARSRAAELKLKVQSGIDPEAEKLAARQARQDSEDRAAKEITFAKLADRYKKEHAVHKRSGRADERRIDRHLLPVWGNRKAKAITRADCRALVLPIAAGDPDNEVAPRPAEAQHVLALARKIFSFAVENEVLDVHPCLGIKIPGGGVKPRERVLTTAKELQAIWAVTDPASDYVGTMPVGWYESKWLRLHANEAACLRFMLLTGCRPGEAAELPWSEIDFEEATWTLPASRSKNKRPTVVPLVPKAVELLKEQKKLDGTHVFPGQKSEKLNVNKLDGGLRRVRAALLKMEVESFTPHDLRRTVETGMAIAKVPKEYRDRVLNHVDSSVGGKHYNKHEYADEKRDALEKWVRRLDMLLETDPANNVIQMRRK